MNAAPFGLAIGGLLLTLVIGLAIGLPIAAVLLRASIGLLNKWMGNEPVREDVQEVAYSDSFEGTRSDDPFAAPMTKTMVTASGGGIPEPTFGRAMVIALVAWIANVAVSLVVGFVLGAILLQAAQAPAQVATSMQLINLISFPFSIAVYTIVLKLMVPTSFLRGLLIVLVQFLIALAIGIAIAGIVMVVIMLVG